MKRMMCVRLGWVTFELVTWPGTPHARGMSRPFLTSFFRDDLYVFSLHFRFRRRDFVRINLSFEPMGFYSWSRAAALSPPTFPFICLCCYLYIYIHVVTGFNSAFSAWRVTLRAEINHTKNTNPTLSFRLC